MTLGIIFIIIGCIYGGWVVGRGGSQDEVDDLQQELLDQAVSLTEMEREYDSCINERNRLRIALIDQLEAPIYYLYIVEGSIVGYSREADAMERGAQPYRLVPIRQTQSVGGAPMPGPIATGGLLSQVVKDENEEKIEFENGSVIRLVK